MNNRMAILNYTFFIDPVQTWTNLYEFEKSFSDFLKAHGLEGTVMKQVEGASSGRIMVIAKAETIPANVPKAVSSGNALITPKMRVDNLSQRNKK
jgi:hypothetical protein